jgi:hypothetical protein
MLSLHFGLPGFVSGAFDRRLLNSAASELRQSAVLLSLTLFMLRIGADHPDHTLAVNNLAVIAHLFN